MLRLLLVAAAVAVVATGSARAAPCPSFPPPIIKFVSLPSDVERDTSRTAKELAATGTATKPLPASYDHALSGSASQSISIQTQPDGTVCAALKEFDVKLGYQRKIYVAKEFAGNDCVVATIADIETPLVKSDDDVLAQYGESIPLRYAADVNAIGISVGKSSDEAKRVILDKLTAVWKEKIFATFGELVTDGAAKADQSKWQKVACDGATDKALASINVKPEDANRTYNPSQGQSPKPTGGYSGGAAGRY